MDFDGSAGNVENTINVFPNSASTREATRVHDGTCPCFGHIPLTHTNDLIMNPVTVGPGGPSSGDPAKFWRMI